MRYGAGHMHYPRPEIVRTATVIAACLVLAACNTIELEEVNPQGVNLTGTWLLDDSASDGSSELTTTRRERGRRPNDQVSERRRDIVRAAGSGFAFITHDFQVLTAQRITIEQNHDSMGIAHRPGIYRDVSWGKKQRGLWEVYAGWEGSDLVIISEAPDLAVQERYQANERQLIVEVSIEADGEKRVVNRVFRRR